MITVQSRPIKDGCNFNCLNPLIYKLRREDYTFDQINDDGGFAQLQFDSVDLTAYFQAADSLYVEGIGLATVSTSSFSGGDTLVTLDVVFTTTSTGYANNLSKRTDHKIEVTVYDYDTDEALGPRIVVDTNAEGIGLADISGILKAYLYADWEEVALNEVEDHTSKKVYIGINEFYDQTLFAETLDAFQIIGVFGFIPLLLDPPPTFTRYAHGGNLLGFFTEDSDSMFLRRMVKLSYWRGYPFTVSFIWPEAISTIDRRVKQYDSEGTLLDDATETLEGGGSGPFIMDRVHRLALGTILDDTHEIKLSLESASVAITEELTIKVKDPCENPVYLFWKNTVGGDSFWLFDETQEYEFTYPSGRRVNRLKLSADILTVDEWQALNEMLSASEVIASNIVDYEMSNIIDKTHFRNDNQVYIISTDSEKLGVIAIPQGANTNTGWRKHMFEVVIELPELFTV